eukprot:TRINITY_DN10237_c0_g1_i6.p1 TRINITY_DN10237_c0_g1~~TRINITY_DN10237_c0_g1_i6.p1  ORF type:complete len:248 (+),score=30.16 TRINITY_DN10237_c0_g1_i6:77-820(+)
MYLFLFELKAVFDSVHNYYSAFALNTSSNNKVQQTSSTAAPEPAKQTKQNLNDAVVKVTALKATVPDHATTTPAKTLSPVPSEENDSAVSDTDERALSPEMELLEHELQRLHTELNNDRFISSSDESNSVPTTPHSSPNLSRASSRASSSRRRLLRQLSKPQPRSNDKIHKHAMKVLDQMQLPHDIIEFLEPGKYHLNGDKSKNIVLQHRGKNLMVAGGGGFVPFATYLKTRHHPLQSPSSNRVSLV